MTEKKYAWVYCYIDAPEDTHDALKSQRQQLMDYAEQMGFEVVGSSSDLGGLPILERSGFQHFMDAVQAGNVSILLIVRSNCLGSSSMQLAKFQALAKGYGIEVYSPLLGKLFCCQ